MTRHLILCLAAALVTGGLAPVAADLVDDMSEVAHAMLRDAKWLKDTTDRLSSQGSPGYSRLKIRTNLLYTDTKALSRTLEDAPDVPEDLGTRLSRIRNYLEDYRKTASTLSVNAEFKQAERRVGEGLADLTEMAGARSARSVRGASLGPRGGETVYSPRSSARPTYPGSGGGARGGRGSRHDLMSENEFRMVVDDLNYLAARLLEQLRAETRNRGQERELAIQDVQAFVQATEILENEWGIHRTRPDRYQKLVHGLMQFRELLTDRFSNLTLGESTRRTWKHASRIIEELDERVTDITR